MAAADGDPGRTVEAVFQRLGPPVLGYLRAAGAAEPEDVLGEVFVRVARGLRSFRGGDAGLRSWVFAIARHCVVDEHRRRSRDVLLRRRVRPATPAADGEPFDPELRAALDRLTDEQREVLTLRFVADLSLAEVASITGSTTGAVKALQHRGLTNLRAQLGGAGRGSTPRKGHSTLEGTTETVTL